MLLSDPFLSPEVFGALLTQPGHHLLTAGEPVVGHLLVRLTEGDAGDILTLYVLPEARRRGVAEGLLTRLDALARREGVLRVTLDVRAGNAPARALYEKLGYLPLAVRRGYYEAPREDAVVYAKDLL